MKKQRQTLIKTFESFTKDNLDYLVTYKKTYVRQQFRDRGIELNKIQKIVKNYDISNFTFDDKGYGIFIYPDTKFIELLKQIDPLVNDNMRFYLTLTGELNQIDFSDGLPPYLRGLGIAYKLYKMTIEKNKYITSDRFSSLHAWNLWYNLLQDKDLYCFTSNIRSGLISKSVSDKELKEIVNKLIVGVNDIEYDDELREKLELLN
jgi:hypothetical protein